MISCSCYQNKMSGLCKVYMSTNKIFVLGFPTGYNPVRGEPP